MCVWWRKQVTQAVSKMQRMPRGHTTEWDVGLEGRAMLQQRHVQSRLVELCRAKQKACQLSC